MWTILTKGRMGETYLIGADGEKNNTTVPAHDPFEMMGKNADDFDWVKDRPPRPPLRHRLHEAADRVGWRPTHNNQLRGRPEADHRLVPAPTRPGGAPREGRDRGQVLRRASRKRGSQMSRIREGAQGAQEHPWMLVLTCRCTAIPAAGSRRTGSAPPIRQARPTWAPQNNISFNAERGVTRGIHAEPWTSTSRWQRDRFRAWVDLRPGESFGEVYTCVIDPSKAIYVPRGVGNSFQALEDGTAHTYLVNAHWSAELKKTYTFVNLADPELGIEWPIPLSECELSEADKAHPMLKDALPMAPRRTLVTGANGQLGRAVKALAEERGVVGSFDFGDRGEFDFSDPDDYAKIDWTLYGAVINCGAYTAVDAAETPEGRAACLAANAQGPALLAKVCAEHGIALVHISSDYVFDGTREEHGEDESFSPLGVYGQTKRRRRHRCGELPPSTTSCAPAGSSATARTSCAPWRRSPTAAPTPTMRLTR